MASPAPDFLSSPLGGGGGTPGAARFFFLKGIFVAHNEAEQRNAIYSCTFQIQLRTHSRMRHPKSQGHSSHQTPIGLMCEVVGSSQFYLAVLKSQCLPSGTMKFCHLGSGIQNKHLRSLKSKPKPTESAERTHLGSGLLSLPLGPASLFRVGCSGAGSVCFSAAG